MKSEEYNNGLITGLMLGSKVHINNVEGGEYMGQVIRPASSVTSDDDDSTMYKDLTYDCTARNDNEAVYFNQGACTCDKFADMFQQLGLTVFKVDERKEDGGKIYRVGYHLSADGNFDDCTLILTNSNSVDGSGMPDGSGTVGVRFYMIYKDRPNTKDAMLLGSADTGIYSWHKGADYLMFKCSKYSYPYTAALFYYMAVQPDGTHKVVYNHSYTSNGKVRVSPIFEGVRYETTGSYDFVQEDFTLGPSPNSTCHDYVCLAPPWIDGMPLQFPRVKVLYKSTSGGFDGAYHTVGTDRYYTIYGSSATYDIVFKIT